MLTRCIEAAMRRAVVHQLADDALSVGEIPDLQGVWANAASVEELVSDAAVALAVDLQGVWANAASVEACLAELREVLADWILLRLSQQLSVPVIDGLDLTVREVA